MIRVLLADDHAILRERLKESTRGVRAAGAGARVYTKAPGKKAELGSPYVLHRGQTVEDAARFVHKDFAENLKFARLFHVSHDRDGLMVLRTNLIQDGDFLEFHT